MFRMEPNEIRRSKLQRNAVCRNVVAWMMIVTTVAFGLVNRPCAACKSVTPAPAPHQAGLPSNPKLMHECCKGSTPAIMSDSCGCRNRSEMLPTGVNIDAGIRRDTSGLATIDLLTFVSSIGNSVRDRSLHRIRRPEPPSISLPPLRI